MVVLRHRASEDAAQYAREIKFHKKHKVKMVRSAHSPAPVRELALVSNDFLKFNDYFVFRFRTALDEDGHVAYCHYAKTKYFHWQGAGYVDLKLVSNPTPNDTNIEEAMGSPREHLWENLMEAKRKREAQARSEAVVSEIARDFLGALKKGDLEEIRKYTNDWENWRRLMAQQWFDETAPKFTSGEYEAEVEPKAFVYMWGGIVPYRIWKSGKKDDFEMKFFFLYRDVPDKDDNWKVHFGTADGDKIKRPVPYYLEVLFSQYMDYKKACMNGEQHPLGTEGEAGDGARPEQANLAQQKEIVAEEATGETLAALAKAVSGFLAALKGGDRETAAAAYGSVTPTQTAGRDQWLSRALPFFSSGKVAADVEPKAWVAGEAAVVSSSS